MIPVGKPLLQQLLNKKEEEQSRAEHKTKTKKKSDAMNTVHFQQLDIFSRKYLNGNLQNQVRMTTWKEKLYNIATKILENINMQFTPYKPVRLQHVPKTYIHINASYGKEH